MAADGKVSRPTGCWPADGHPCDQVIFENQVPGRTWASSIQPCTTLLPLCALKTLFCCDLLEGWKPTQKEILAGIGNSHHWYQFHRDETNKYFTKDCTKNGESIVFGLLSKPETYTLFRVTSFFFLSLKMPFLELPWWSSG